MQHKFLTYSPYRRSTAVYPYLKEQQELRGQS